MTVLVIVTIILKLLSLNLDVLTEVFLILAFTAGFMALYETFVVKPYRSPDAGLIWNDYGHKLFKSFQSKDLYIKFLGLALTLAFFYLLYLTPHYQGDYFSPFFEFLVKHSVLITTVSFVYFIAVHAALDQPKDGLWHAGACLIPSLWRDVNRHKLKEYFLAVLIKAFFLPLMFIFVITEWNTLQNFSYVPADIKEFFALSFHSIYFLDVTLATIGYIFTLRIFDAHVRYPEMRWGGWIVCIMCYAPFNQVIFGNFITYHDNLDWHHWIGDYPVLYVFWGSLILLGNIIFVFATINFGLRFSNLTHRGIITHGAYAFSKHPAYISKNINWWLMEIPMLGVSFGAALKNTLMLMVVNLVYYMRAKYEESMLMQDPVYQKYAEYIQENGLLAVIRKHVLKSS